MKKIYYLMVITILLGTFSLRAQNTEGTEFWVAFGQNYLHLNNAGNHMDSLTLQIRLVSKELPISGSLHFTALDDSIPFNIPARAVYTYNLNNEEKEAVYNKYSGIFNSSVRILCDHPVTAYALNQVRVSADATNLLPVPVWGTEHYQISYIPGPEANYINYDAYAIIAIEDGTRIYENSSSIPWRELNAGEVFYRTSEYDMTGTRITSNKPIAFFALNQGVMIPAIYGGSRDCFMQQLAPVNTWGKKFFIPVADLTTDTYYDTKNRVRIVASQNNTTIRQTGGTLIYDSGGEMGYTINAGQFIEMEITLNKNGCFIEADKPVGVCAYLTSGADNNGIFSDPAMAWLPSIEQSVPEGMIAPFIPTGVTAITAHSALITTPTATKNDTRVSIGGGAPTALSGRWMDNADAGMSFYNMPLTNPTASYFFTNQNGLFVMGYGTGNAESYYYLGFSGMRNLEATFYANNISYQDLPSHLFCTNEIAFRAQIEGMSPNPESLKWYINGIEEVAAQDQLTWNKNFLAGKYEIKMTARSIDESIKILESTLNIGAQIHTVASPAIGGTTTGDGCYKVGDLVNVTATPRDEYEFVYWAKKDVPISTEANYTFTATDSCTLVAIFKTFHKVTVEVNISEYGSATGGGIHESYTTVEVQAFPANCYRFLNWTVDATVVSTDNSYEFIVTEDITLVANFYAMDFDTYAPTLWDNTFMLNLKLLADEGYSVTGCRWFKNGIEEIDTRTINEFSYSAGPYLPDLLKPAHYMYQLMTKNYGCLNSTVKTVTFQNAPAVVDRLAVSPNPVLSGAPFTIDGVIKDNPIHVYNQYGVCVSSTIATGNTTTLSLHLPAGIYFIRTNNKEIKIIVI